MNNPIIYDENIIAPQFIGTASWAQSVVSGSGSSSFASSSLEADIAIIATNAITASYALAISGSILNTGSTYPITASWASSVLGSNVIGSVGSAVTATTATTANSATSASYSLSGSFAVSAISSSWSPNQGATTLFTGSTYFITSSWASNAASANTATSATTANSATSASYSLSASFTTTASFALNAGSGTTLFTGSTYQITASWANTATNATSLNQSAVSNTGPYYIGFVNSNLGGNTNHFVSSTGDLSYNASTKQLTATGITASLNGTSSWAITASFALNGGSGGGSGTTLFTGSTYPITSSWANNVPAAGVNGTVANATNASNATSATNATNTSNISASTTNTNASFPLVFVPGPGLQPTYISVSGLSYNPTSSVLILGNGVNLYNLFSALVVDVGAASAFRITPLGSDVYLQNHNANAQNTIIGGQFTNALLGAVKALGNFGFYADNTYDFGISGSTNIRPRHMYVGTDVTAPTFIGALNGNASTATSATNATNATNIGVASDTTNASRAIVFVSGTGNNPPWINSSGLTFNPSTNQLTTTGITASLNGTASWAINTVNGGASGTTVYCGQVASASFAPISLAGNTYYTASVNFTSALANTNYRAVVSFENFTIPSNTYIVAVGNKRTTGFDVITNISGAVTFPAGVNVAYHMIAADNAR